MPVLANLSQSERAKSRCHGDVILQQKFCSCYSRSSVVAAASQRRVNNVSAAAA